MSEQLFNVTLQCPGPWGFRLAGGIDFNQPLSISRITPGGKASVSHVLPSDIVLRIDGEDTTHMTHLDAQNKIKNCVGDLTLTLSRGESKIWKPKVTPMTAEQAGHHATPYSVSLKADQQDSYGAIGTGHNVTAKPFPGSGTAKVVHLQYNSPVGLYSAQNIAETFKGQTEGLITGVVGGGEEAGPVDTGTGSYQAVHAGDQPRGGGYQNPGSQSRSFQMLQDMVDQDAGGYPSGGGGGSPAYGGVAPPHAEPQYSPSTIPSTYTPGTSTVTTSVTLQPTYQSEEKYAPTSYGTERNKEYDRSGEVQSEPSYRSPDSGVDRNDQHERIFGSANPGAQSRSFKMLQQMVADEDGSDVYGGSGAPASTPPSGGGGGGPGGFRSVRPPSGGTGISNKPPQTTPMCEGCDHGIVGPFVRIKGKSYHPECFVCADCHCSLKNQGYFDVGGKLYCERDARSKVQPPPGAEQVVLPGRGGTSPGQRPAATSPAYQPSQPAYKPTQHTPHQTPAMAAGHGRSTAAEIQSIRPAFKSSSQPDPNEVIARALSQNPDATKDIHGIKPIFTQTQTASSLDSRSPLSSPAGSFDSGLSTPLSPDERITQALQAQGDIVVKPLSAPHQYAAAARGPLGPSKPLPPRPAGAPRQQIQRGAMTKTSVPPGTRTPMCHSCGETIRGPFVNAVGKNWHPEHFHCSHCGDNLMELGFVEEGGQMFCEKDYTAYFAAPCAKCQQPIVGDTLNALDKAWHPECFVCTQCHLPFSSMGAGSSFHVEDGKPFCERDWNEMFTTKCAGCQFPIEPGDKWVEALDTQWHSGCFTCSVCHANLEGQSFYAKQGRPYCRAHASS
ncbi:PDZ and LIM domain protein 5-like isoform X2 [Glandiceps talaboti]